MTTIAVLFLPSLFGLLWQNDPGISIVWSLAGSLFIAVTAQTRWFRQPGDDVPITYRLLHPSFMYHLFFVGNHVVGGAFYALNNAGHSFWAPVDPSEYGMSLNATAQGLMLLAHASTTAGMKLAGHRYDPPKYQIQYVPPYSLLVFSLICLGLGNVLGAGPAFRNVGQKIFQIASTAVLV